MEVREVFLQERISELSLDRVGVSQIEETRQEKSILCGRDSTWKGWEMSRRV